MRHVAFLLAMRTCASRVAHQSRETVHVFPYVTAADVNVILPEPALRPEAAPPALPNIPALEETISQLRKQAEEERMRRAGLAKSEAALAGKGAISGPTAQAYIDAGEAGVAAAAAMTTSERFGPGIGRAVVIVSFLNFVPFLWCSFSGASQQLFPTLVATTASYGLHDFCLAWLMNAFTWAGTFTPLFLAFLCAMTGLFSGLYLTKHMWMFAVFWFNLTILMFVRGFPIIGPFAWVNIMPSLPPVHGFYVLVSIISILMTVGLFWVCTDEYHAVLNSMVTAVVCSFGALSGFSVLFEMAGKPAPYDFMKFLSIPSTIDFRSQTTLILTVILCILMGTGIWINRLRYKQFGFTVDEEAAKSLMQRQPATEDVE